jgi:hypothetical protein
LRQVGDFIDNRRCLRSLCPDRLAMGCCRNRIVPFRQFPFRGGRRRGFFDDRFYNRFNEGFRSNGSLQNVNRFLNRCAVPVLRLKRRGGRMFRLRSRLVAIVFRLFNMDRLDWDIVLCSSNCGVSLDHCWFRLRIDMIVFHRRLDHLNRRNGAFGLLYRFNSCLRFDCRFWGFLFLGFGFGLMRLHHGRRSNMLLHLGRFRHRVSGLLVQRGKRFGVIVLDLADRRLELDHLAFNHLVRRTRLHAFKLTADGAAGLVIDLGPHFGNIVRQTIDGPSNNCNKIRHQNFLIPSACLRQILP